jgi:hypothetical protein
MAKGLTISLPKRHPVIGGAWGRRFNHRPQTGTGGEYPRLKTGARTYELQEIVCQR